MFFQPFFPIDFGWGEFCWFCFSCWWFDCWCLFGCGWFDGCCCYCCICSCCCYFCYICCSFWCFCCCYLVFWETGVSSPFRLPGSTFLCWDGLQVPDLACLVRLLLMLLLLLLWVWSSSFECRFLQSDLTVYRTNRRPPALYDYHQISFSIRNDVRDGLEALSNHTYVRCRLLTPLGSIYICI